MKKIEDKHKKLTLYVLIPILVIALIVLLIDGRRSNKDIEIEEDVSIEEVEEVQPQSIFMNEKLGKKIYKEAENYLKKDTVYKNAGKGEDDKSILIDCSGLIVDCYKKVLEDSDFILPFSDATANELYSLYTDSTTTPHKGDLIFMTYNEEKTVSHVGIVEEIKKDTVYFIDATPNEENKSGKAVNKRKYKTDDPKIISYGIMKLLEKE